MGSNQGSTYLGLLLHLYSPCLPIIIYTHCISGVCHMTQHPVIHVHEILEMGGGHSFVVLLRLPSCHCGFESQADHLRFFQFVLLKL